MLKPYRVGVGGRGGIKQIGHKPQSSTHSQGQSHTQTCHYMTHPRDWGVLSGRSLA